MEPVAIETSEQRLATAIAQAELRRARFIPVLWTTRILVILIGAPVALFGVSAGMLMARQDRNADAVALLALSNRIEQRLAECVARDDAPLPLEATYVVENADEPRVTCVGPCPALPCVTRAIAPLVRQAPLGFSRTLALDLSADRLIALEQATGAVAREAGRARVRIETSADRERYELRCDDAHEVVARVDATFRAAQDAARLRDAIARARCTNF